MAQPTPEEPNGVTAAMEGGEHENGNGHVVLPGKRKRESEDEGGESSDDDGEEEEEEDDDDDRKADSIAAEDEAEPDAWGTRDQKVLVKTYFDVLKSIDIEPPILERSLADSHLDEEPQAKRQKSAEPPLANVANKVAKDAYEHVEDMAADILLAVKAALADDEGSDETDGNTTAKTTERIRQFKDRAIELLRRERAYPETPTLDIVSDDADEGEAVLSVVGYAPQERRLFSSLPVSKGIVDLSKIPGLPPGVTLSHVKPSTAQEKVQTLGEIFAPLKPLPPLQPPKLPKTQAKGNTLDFYHPELADRSRFKGPSYFTTRLSAGHYLDYSQATPSSPSKTKQHERAQSLAGKKPSTTELEVSEMESLFRGAFSSFAPCKDDSAAVVPSSLAGRMWWQRAGQRNFQRMIEVEYYDELEGVNGLDANKPVDLDETALQDAIDNWDEIAIDPSLEDAMGSKQDDHEKEAEEILDEVSDMIETLASYQRIRNLTLPNSQNRQSSDPVAGDMLANAGPQPSEEEQATYQVLKAQLVLIIKTLPPYVVAKLNGDQLDDLLISTRIQVESDQYKGVMEEDDAGVQARLRAQQQQQQQQAQQQQAQQQAQASIRPPSQQRTASMSYPNQHVNQYGTPNRTPSHTQQQFRPAAAPHFQQPRNVSAPVYQQQRPPQPNQYSRPNGFHPNQYATQVAKAQTPYGHQNMPQFASQQRPQYGQMPQPGTPNARFQQYQPGTPTPGNYGQYPNGAAMPPRTMSPQVQRQPYTQSPNMQQNRYGTPNQGMNSQMNRFPSNPAQGGSHASPGLTGYHTVIPEAQQQRILDQAKARVAAQERSAMFGDKISQPGMPNYSGMSLGGAMDASRLAAARASMMNQQKPQTPVGQRPGMNGTPVTNYVPPSKVTPVPIPNIPGSQPQRRPT